MQIDLEVENDNILVTELTDDIVINGLTTMYDPDSPYMFCKAVAVAEDVPVLLDCKPILVIKRYAKEEFIPGYYFISYKDVRCSLSEEEYKKLIAT